MERTHYWLREVKAAVNHDVLQQFLICAETKWGKQVKGISITNDASE